ncbi:MAG: cysteine desulfurase [Thaumarchaeota archaeon]|nr:cysteine desulfurase [Nitrososphaerota archaeon]
MIDVEEIRNDFPILQKKDPPIYFDNACTTLKPSSVIQAVVQYYSAYSGCAGRSAHHLAKQTDEDFELARQNIAKFVNSGSEELAFTKNTTEAINLVAKSLDLPSSKNEIVTTIMEHHSAYLPFYERCKETKAKLSTIQNPTSLAEWNEKINKTTGLIVVHGINNTLGTGTPIAEIVKIAHDTDAYVMVDGAQSVPHSITDFRKYDLDFLAFSGHKMLGPTGIGCLIGKQELLRKIRPFIVGGGTIETVNTNGVRYLDNVHRLEGGIQHYAGAVGLSAAVSYLKKIGMENIENYEKALISEMEKRAKEIENLTVYGNFKEKKSAILTFNLSGIPAHQVTLMLDKMKGICTRSGVFCAQPAMESLGAKDGAVRASLYLYNSIQEIDVFFNTIEEIAKTLGG